MRVAVVAPEHPLSKRHGGIARYLRDYVPALAMKAEVHLVSIEPGPALEGVPQVVVGEGAIPSAIAPPFRSRRCLRALRRLQPDVVEYANWLALSCADTGPWARVMRLSTPVSFGTLRDGLLPRLARPLHLYWERRALGRVHHCISNTAANVRTCTEAYGELPECTVIPHGVNLTEDRPDPKADDVLFVGRFEDRKGVDILLRAWADVAADPAVPSSTVLHLVGRDTPGHGGEGYLADVMRGVSIPSGRLLVHGSLPGGELAELRRRCAVCVVPSRYESFGMVCLEAFAAGQAVIASRAGGLAEVVQDGCDGLLVPPEDPAALAVALTRLLRDPGFAAGLATEARQSLVRRFSVAQMVDRSLAVYTDVIAARRSADRQEEA